MTAWKYYNNTTSSTSSLTPFSYFKSCDDCLEEVRSQYPYNNTTRSTSALTLFSYYILLWSCMTCSGPISRLRTERQRMAVREISRCVMNSWVLTEKLDMSVNGSPLIFTWIQYMLAHPRFVPQLPQKPESSPNLDPYWEQNAAFVEVPTDGWASFPMVRAWAWASSSLTGSTETAWAWWDCTGSCSTGSSASSSRPFFVGIHVEASAPLKYHYCHVVSCEPVLHRIQWLKSHYRLLGCMRELRNAGQRSPWLWYAYAERYKRCSE